MKALITGTTGVVGKEILEQLPSHVECLTFARTPEKLPENIKGIYGDLEKEGLGIENWDFFKDVEVVIHLAANTKWSLSDEDAMRVNTRATETLLNKVQLHCPKLQQFIYVSTAFVDTVSHLKSKDPFDRSNFNNSYEYSKSHAEEIVRTSGIPYSIIRPSIIIGRRSDGYISSYSGIYQMFELFFSGKLPAIIGFEDAVLDLVPVDDVAAKILQQATSIASCKTSYISAGESAPTLKEVLLVLQGFISLSPLKDKIPPLPSFVKPETFERFFLPMIKSNPQIPIGHYLKVIHFFKPYLSILKKRTFEQNSNLADHYDMPKLMQTCFFHWIESNARKFLLQSGRINSNQRAQEIAYDKIQGAKQSMDPVFHKSSRLPQRRIVSS